MSTVSPIDKIAIVPTNPSPKALLETTTGSKKLAKDDGAIPTRVAYSASAIVKEAPPPKPLSNATICGIEVICTFNAITPPIIPPTMTPAIT